MMALPEVVGDSEEDLVELDLTTELNSALF